MLANWVKQSTTTTGTGTITLDGTPPAGFIAFSDVFKNNQLVHYTIEDGTNRELGYGTLTSGANWTLSRDILLAKLESGTYTENPTTGINLSGSAVVSVTSSAEAIESIPYILPNSGTVKGYAGRLLHTNNASAAFFADNTIYLARTKIEVPITIDALSFKVTISSGSKTCQLAVYGSSQSVNEVGPLLANTADISVSSSGSYEAAIVQGTVRLPIGWYWLGYAQKTGSGLPSVNYCSVVSGTGIADFSISSTELITVQKSLGTWTSLPDPLGAYDSASFYAPHVLMRRV